MKAMLEHLKKGLLADPFVRSILKRSLIILLVFTMLGIGASKLVDNLPFFSFGIIVVFSIITGLLNQWSYDRNDRSLSLSEMFLEAVLLTAVAWGSCAVVLYLNLYDKFYLAGGVLFFLLPMTFTYILESHRNRPRHVRVGVCPLSWLEARVDYAIIPSKSYIVFRYGNQQIGYSVDRALIKGISLQELWSNYLHRHNATAMQADLINPAQLFFFKKPRLWLAWRYLTPTTAIKNLHLNWKTRIRVIDRKRALIKVIYIYVDVEETNL